MKSFRASVLLFALLVSGHGWLQAAGGFSKPEPIVTPQPRFSDELIAKPCSAYAQLLVNEFGFVTDATIVQSSDPRMNEPVLAALRRWKFKPAMEDGTAVPCFVVQPVRFSNGIIVTQPETREDRDPAVRNRVIPTLPRELQTVDGYVTARVEVSAQGDVTRAEISESSHPELDGVVLAAVAKWTFTPAVRGGQNAPCRVAIPFHFKPDPKLLPRDVKKSEDVPADSLPVALRRIPPEVPGSLIGVEANAEIEFVVDQYGNVVTPSVVTSSHDEFAEAALDAIRRWRFKPAVQNGQAVAVRARQAFTMNQQVLSENRPSDSQPKVRKTVAPEVPDGLRGVAGQVDVLLAIDENGNVTDVQVRKASYEEFSAVAVAAARQWKFTAALRDGKPVASSVVVPFVFGR